MELELTDELAGQIRELCAPNIVIYEAAKRLTSTQITEDHNNEITTSF